MPEDRGKEAGIDPSAVKVRADQGLGTIPFTRRPYNAYKPRKRNQQDAGQGIYMINPYNFSICDTTDWALDIGSPIHICNLL